MTYDSRPDTYAHIQVVQSYLLRAVAYLQQRALVHDSSKLESPEREGFDEFTPRLADSTYGSEEYRNSLEAMQPFLKHHYAVNSHHPEHHQAGIAGMDLLDLLEMICDWMAAVQRHKNGDVRRSIEQNQKRFGYSDELKSILRNTVDALEP